MSRVCSLVDGDVGGEVLGDGVDLAGGVAEVLVTLVPELPVLRLVILHAPAMHGNDKRQRSARIRVLITGLTFLLGHRNSTEMTENRKISVKFG